MYTIEKIKFARSVKENKEIIKFRLLKDIQQSFLYSLIKTSLPTTKYDYAATLDNIITDYVRKNKLLKDYNSVVIPYPSYDQYCIIVTGKVVDEKLDEPIPVIYTYFASLDNERNRLKIRLRVVESFLGYNDDGCKKMPPMIQELVIGNIQYEKTRDYQSLNVVTDLTLIGKVGVEDYKTIQSLFESLPITNNIETLRELVENTFKELYTYHLNCDSKIWSVPGFYNNVFKVRVHADGNNSVDYGCRVDNNILTIMADCPNLYTGDSPVILQLKMKYAFKNK